MHAPLGKICFFFSFHFRSFLSHLTPQRQLFEPFISPSPPQQQQITFYTQPLPQQQQQDQRHLVPRQAQASQQHFNYVWPNLINPLNLNTPFDSYEPEAEFVPLEAQQQNQHNQYAGQHGRNNEEKPFGKYFFLERIQFIYF